MNNIYHYEYTSVFVIHPCPFINFWGTSGGLSDNVPSTTTYSQIRIRIPITMCNNVKPSSSMIERNKAVFNKPVTSMKVVDYSEPPKVYSRDTLISMLHRTPDESLISVGIPPDDFMNTRRDLLQAVYDLLYETEKNENTPNYRDWFFNKFNKIL